MFLLLIIVFRDVVCFLRVCFFFKQKTAYEMRISDWSSDVCSSDLPAGDFAAVGDEDLFKHACLCSEALPFKGRVGWGWVSPGLAAQPGSLPALLPGSRKPRGSRTAARQIGRAHV